MAMPRAFLFPLPSGPVGGVVLGSNPAALQLRYFQTLSEIASEKNTTIIIPSEVMIPPPIHSQPSPSPAPTPNPNPSLPPNPYTPPNPHRFLTLTRNPNPHRLLTLILARNPNPPRILILLLSLTQPLTSTGSPRASMGLGGHSP